MTIEDFLSWEARQADKFEFDGYEPVAMAGGSLNHARIQRNLAVALTTRLRGSACEFLGSEMKLLSSNGARYPDGQIVCGPAEGQATFTTSPSVLFEVLSPDDDRRDRVVKAAEYANIASGRTYVILEHDSIAATVLTRLGNGWSTAQLGPSDSLALPDLGLIVPVVEFYEGVPPAVQPA